MKKPSGTSKKGAADPKARKAAKEIPLEALANVGGGQGAVPGGRKSSDVTLKRGIIGS
jgi:hypothetical protein